MNLAYEKYDFECQDILSKFKTLLYSKTSLSEQNKQLEFDDFPIFSELLTELQVELFNKLTEVNDSLNLNVVDTHLEEIGKQYIQKFVHLVDLKPD